MTPVAAPAGVRAGRVDGLDLVRGAAVGLVVLRHALPEVFPGAGVVGVVAFFTLSGYLITGLLVSEHARTGRVDLRRFYRRRARRLLPPLLVLLVVHAAVTLLLDPLGDRRTLPRDLLVALTWTGDLPRLTPGGATFHLWTLAVEEQFYLLWPALLLLCSRRGRPGGALVVALALALPALVGTAWWAAGDPDVAYALPTSWAPAFVLGAAARMLGGRRRLPPLATPAAVLALAVLSVVPLRGHLLTYLVGGPAIAALTAVVVVSAAGWARVTAPPLTWLTRLGTVSYAAYLWNYPLALWLRPLPGGAVLSVVATVAAAAVSWRLVEEPLAARWRRSPA